VPFLDKISDVIRDDGIGGFMLVRIFCCYGPGRFYAVIGHRLRVHPFLLLFFGLLPVFGFASDPRITSVDQVLQRLASAMQEHSFRGEFIYQQSGIGAIESLEIVHSVINGVEYETL